MLAKSLETLKCREDEGFPRYRTVVEAIRSFIVENKLKPGDRLPSYRMLLTKLDISDGTAQRALGILQEEGWIDRQHGRGIFIKDRNLTGEFAVVVRPQLLDAEASPYYRMAVNRFLEVIYNYDPRWKLNIHMGKRTLIAEEFPETLDLAEPDVLKKLRGVFSFHPLLELERKLENANVPLIQMCGRGGQYSVIFDPYSCLHESLDHLRAVGCRTVGFFGFVDTHVVEKQGDCIFKEYASSIGIEYRPEWISCIQENITERVGYEMFMRFWRQSTRPEALLVTDDILCRGVLRAILHMGIKLPDEFRLITQANRGVELPYHLPVTRYEIDSFQQVHEAVEMMLGLIQGCEPLSRKMLISGELVRGATT